MIPFMGIRTYSQQGMTHKEQELTLHNKLHFILNKFAHTHTCHTFVHTCMCSVKTTGITCGLHCNWGCLWHILKQVKQLHTQSYLCFQIACRLQGNCNKIFQVYLKHSSFHGAFVKEFSNILSIHLLDTGGEWVNCSNENESSKFCNSLE